MEIWNQFSHKDVEIFVNIDLNKYSTFKLKSFGNLAIVKSLSGLISFGDFIKKNNLNISMLGLGANQILRSKNNRFIYLKLAINNTIDELSSYKDKYYLSASINLNHLTNSAKKFNLKGWEVFTGIPATLGGAVAMNAGTSLGEIGSLVTEVTLLRDLKDICKIKIDKSHFKYRGNNFLLENDILLNVEITHFGIDSSIPEKIDKYLQFRKDTQPWLAKSCGCVFKNYSNTTKAGQLIDLLGLKGLSNGGIKVSPIHANFFENYEIGTLEDFLELKDTIDKCCERFYGIKFELEVKF